MSPQQQRVYWPYIISSYFALFAFGFLDNVRGPFFPDIIRDLQLTDTQAAWFFGMASLMAFFGSYFAPHMLLKMSSLWGLRIGLIIVCLGFSGFAFIQNFTHLLLLSAVFGLGLGMLQVFQHTSIHEGASELLRRRMFNGLHSMYALASLFAPILAAACFNLGFSWRTGFLAFTLLPFVALVQSFTARSLVEENPDHKSISPDPKEFKKIVYVATAIALYVTSELSLTTRLVLYLRREYSMEAVFATHYLTLFFILLFVGRFLFVVFNFKAWSNLRILQVSLGLSLLFYSLGLRFSPWLLSFCGLTMAPFFGVAMDFIAVQFKEKASLGMSLSLAIGSLFIVSMHYLVGLLSDQIGLGRALWLGPGFLCLSFVMTSLYFYFFPTPHLQANANLLES